MLYEKIKEKWQNMDIWGFRPTVMICKWRVLCDVCDWWPDELVFLCSRQCFRSVQTSLPPTLRPRLGGSLQRTTHIQHPSTGCFATKPSSFSSSLMVNVLLCTQQIHSGPQTGVYYTCLPFKHTVVVCYWKH